MAFYESDKTGKEIKLPPLNKDEVALVRETSFTKDGKFPITYERDNILPGF